MQEHTAAVAPKSPATPAKPVAPSKPLPIDPTLLRHVSGGVRTNAPNGNW